MFFSRTAQDSLFQLNQKQFFKSVSKNTSLKILKKFTRKLPQWTAILL